MIGRSLIPDGAQPYCDPGSHVGPVLPGYLRRYEDADGGRRGFEHTSGFQPGG